MAPENGSASNQLQGNINVTPMIDVLLVLLIIFMVIAPAMPHGIVAALPHRSTSPIQNPDTPIVVQIIRAPGGILIYKINQEEVRFLDLAPRLNAMFSVRAEKAMFVKADDKLDFSAVAQVLDIGKGTGADHIGLVGSM